MNGSLERVVSVVRDSSSKQVVILLQEVGHRHPSKALAHPPLAWRTGCSQQPPRCSQLPTLTIRLRALRWCCSTSIESATKSSPLAKGITLIKSSTMAGWPGVNYEDGLELQKAAAAITVLANDIAVCPRCDQQRARVAPRLGSALPRCGHRGRPGEVIASTHGLPPASNSCGQHQAAQSTSGSPSIRLNSLTLWLTTVAPMARA